MRSGTVSGGKENVTRVCEHFQLRNYIGTEIIHSKCNFLLSAIMVFLWIFLVCEA